MTKVSDCRVQAFDTIYLHNTSIPTPYPSPDRLCKNLRHANLTNIKKSKIAMDEPNMCRYDRNRHRRKELWRDREKPL
jgi:hypothetical protein